MNQAIWTVTFSRRVLTRTSEVSMTPAATYLTKSTLCHGRLTTSNLHSQSPLEQACWCAPNASRGRPAVGGCAVLLTRACDIPFVPGSKLTCTHLGDLPRCQIVRCLTNQLTNKNTSDKLKSLRDIPWFSHSDCWTDSPTIRCSCATQSSH